MKMARLDFMTMKSQRILWLTIPIYVFFGVMDTSSSAMSSLAMWITAAWFSVLISTSLFAIQEKDHLNKLYGSMALSAKDVVFGRYLFVVLLYAVSFMMTLVISFIMSLVLHQKPIMPIGEFAFGFSLSLLLFAVLAGIQFPIYFRFGYTKAKVIAMIPFLGIMSVFLLRSLIDISGLIDFLTARQNIAALGGILASIVILFVSYSISVVAYRKQR
jgi:hypothetical protein